jgi:Protein of unknown function (DUF3237)
MGRPMSWRESKKEKWWIRRATISEINPLFETANANYDWLNRVVAVGIGHRRADGPIYSIFEVL